MSIDQTIVCRTRPNLPDDLPARVPWIERQHRGFTFYEHDAGSWLVHVAHEDEAELRDEMIAEVFGSEPPDGACVVGVTLEPVTRNAEAIGLLEEVITLLEQRCGGVVLPA
jgi:hypothetical protein